MMTPVVQPEPTADAGTPRAGRLVDTLCRPMLRHRPDAELRAAAPALRPWLTGEDFRLKAFALGALWAFKWTEGIDATTPVTREQLAQPNFRDQLAECAMASLVAEGILPSPAQGLSDTGRVLARGSEVWLTWWLWPSAPLPALLAPDAAASEVAAMLGEVGLGATGMDGPAISPARLPRLRGARLMTIR